MEKDLKQKIDLAIQQENFERAAKLRDIYLHIEQFVEKQHVELPKNTSGYVVEIRQI
ncbi:MAG: UvrB/UvrC motif-containing protein [Candidatus Peribacteria bacterium]|nr:UvrB/UvrC motif-containing protein [Candidatus Peribacteria bacterium]